MRLPIANVLLAGGLLLLWVCFKMWQELHGSGHDIDLAETGGTPGSVGRKTLRQAVTQIVVADVSILPTITRANTNLPAVMIGERIAATLAGRLPDTGR